MLPAEGLAQRKGASAGAPVDKSEGGSSTIGSMEKRWEIPDLRSDTLRLNWTRGSHTIAEVRGGEGSNYEHGEGE